MSSDEFAESAGGTAAPDDTLRRERDDLYERLLRTTAEFDNYRKRTDRERREFAEAAGMDVIRDLLPVVDDLERALAAPAEAGAEIYREGVEMIRRQLLEVIRRRGVEPIEAIGKPFDPEWHEAIGSDPADGRPDGQITTEVRRGYRLGSRLLRPAMVKVAKA